MARRKKAAAKEDAGRWMVSYADLLTLLFALFVVLYGFAMSAQSEVKSIVQGLVQSFTDMGFVTAHNGNVVMTSGYGVDGKEAPNNSTEAVMNLVNAPVQGAGGVIDTGGSASGSSSQQGDQQSQGVNDSADVVEMLSQGGQGETDESTAGINETAARIDLPLYCFCVYSGRALSGHGNNRQALQRSCVGYVFFVDTHTVGDDRYLLKFQSLGHFNGDQGHLCEINQIQGVFVSAHQGLDLFGKCLHSLFVDNGGSGLRILTAVFSHITHNLFQGVLPYRFTIQADGEDLGLKLLVAILGDLNGIPIILVQEEELIRDYLTQRFPFGYTLVGVHELIHVAIQIEGSITAQYAAQQTVFRNGDVLRLVDTDMPFGILLIPIIQGAHTQGYV